MSASVEEVLDRLRALGDPTAIVGRARFGIPEDDALGVPLPALRRLAKELGPDHLLARELWATGIHEARLLATLVEEPSRATRAQVETWLRDDVRSWDVCDGLAMNLIDRTPWAYDAVERWASSEHLWVKRAAFATLASLSIEDKDAPDARFRALLPLCEREAHDARPYVQKAISWALRQTGKKRPGLRPTCAAIARRLASRPDKASRWVGKDALRELAAAPRPE